MITAEIQIHGYRKGHQLLASSFVLPKEDQVVVDRLSDVAGPLRPKEQFTPYLSAYPLPSGNYYVLARTWQDLIVPRAGCVRTKSVFIDAQAWSFKPPISKIISILNSIDLPTEAEAVSIEFEENSIEHFPPVINFNSNELLEALFLEDMKPVVVFDAPDPELVALRLISALWPGIRQRFALSTFALSPRKVGGRDIDLVFAPSSVRGKFADWPGRRVDGRSSQTDRHRWTESIVHSVFESPVPSLLPDRGNELFGNRGAKSTAALRIALLWNELLQKLDQTPNAVLGLLDISNSGMVNKAAAIRALEPRLEKSMRKAANDLSPTDAWDFVSAIANKLQGHAMPTGKIAVDKLAERLAERSPEGAINLLRQLDSKNWIQDLIPSIAIGLGNGLAPKIEELLVEAPAAIIARLVSQGGALTARVAQSEALIERMGAVLYEVDQELADQAARMLLPYLIEDRHFVAANPIFCRLDLSEVAATLHRLGEANDFRSSLLCNALIDRAIEVNGLSIIREVLISTSYSVSRDALLSRTLFPVKTDLLWLLRETRLPEKTFSPILESVLRNADDAQFTLLFSDQMLGELIVQCLPSDAVDLLVRAVMQNNLPMGIYLSSIRTLILRADDKIKFEIALRVIERCMRSRFDGNELADLCMLLGIIGTRLNGAWICKLALERSVDAEVASRNLIAFEKAPTEARKCIVRAVDEIAVTLNGRYIMDLTEPAYDACARLMLDAGQSSRKTSIRAAGLLMPTLLSANNRPVSRLIAALFPIIYRELAKSDDVPELLKFVPFVDWDRCKRARQKLVEAFMHSSWKAGDLALTALMCNDLSRILNLVAKSYGGKEYLKQVESDLDNLEEVFQKEVKTTISKVRSGKIPKYHF